MKVMMVGTGYVGLTTGICFAEMGHEVVCFDTDQKKIDTLLSKNLPIYEPGLKDALIRNIDKGQIEFTTSRDFATSKNPDFVFICVGTPSDENTGEANLSFVYKAAEQVAASMKEKDGFTVFVNKSTVPVGTAQQVEKIVGNILPRDVFAVASNPEFLREGSAIHDFMNPDRIIVGSSSETARKMLEELYRPLTRVGHALVMTSTVETAELIKYTANGFLAMKVAFINEVALICEKAGADVEELSLGIGLDRRIGRSFLSPGPGYGGSCFPKDTLALAVTAKQLGSPATIIEQVIASNDAHKNKMVQKIKNIVGDLKGKRIAVLGLAFKANTDDMRDSASLTILPQLQDAGAKIVAYDPIAREAAAKLLEDVTFADTLDELVVGADVALILTEWTEFRHADWNKLSTKMAKPLLIDLRNMFNPVQIKQLGLEYHCLGRK